MWYRAHTDWPIHGVLKPTKNLRNIINVFGFKGPYVHLVPKIIAIDLVDQSEPRISPKIAKNTGKVPGEPNRMHYSLNEKRILASHILQRKLHISTTDRLEFYCEKFEILFIYLLSIAKLCNKTQVVALMGFRIKAITSHFRQPYHSALTSR